MASSAQPPQAAAAPEGEKEQAGERHRLRKLTESESAAMRTQGYTETADALASPKPPHGGIIHHVMQAALADLTRIKGMKDNAITSEVANLGLAAAKFICEAAHRRVSGSSSPAEVAAPVLLIVARIANVAPPDVHRASLDAICHITGLILASPACMQQPAMKETIEQLLRGSSGAAAQQVACCILACVAHHLKPASPLEANCLVVEFGPAIRFLHEFSPRLHTATSKDKGHQFRQQLLPEGTPDVVPSLSALWSGLGIKMGADGSVPSVSFELLMQKDKVAAAMAATKEALNEREQGEEPGIAADISTVEGAARTISQVVDPAAAPAEDVQPAAGADVPQVRREDSLIERAMGVAIEHSGMLKGLVSLAASVSSKGQDKPTHELSLKTWLMASSAGIAVSEALLLGKGGGSSRLRVALSVGEIERQGVFISKMMDEAHGVLGGEDVDTDSLAALGAATLQAVLDMGLRCSITFTYYTDRVAGVHKINSILLSRLGKSIAALPLSLSKDRAGSMYEAERVAGEVCCARTDATAASAKHWTSQLGFQPLSEMLTGWKDLAPLGDAAGAADADTQYELLEEVPVRVIWAIANTKLPTFYRSADAVFALKSTVNCGDEAPAVVQAEGKLVYSELTVECLRSLAGFLQHLKQATRVPSLPDDAIQYLLGEHSLLLLVEAASIFWQGVRVLDEERARHVVDCHNLVEAIHDNLFKVDAARARMDEMAAKLATIRADLKAVQTPAFDVAAVAADTGKHSAAAQGMQQACKAALAADPATAASIFQQLIAGVGKLTTVAQKLVRSAAQNVGS